MPGLHAIPCHPGGNDEHCRGEFFVFFFLTRVHAKATSFFGGGGRLTKIKNIKYSVARFKIDNWERGKQKEQEFQHQNKH